VTMSRPAPIRIDDLAEPRFAPPIAEAMAAVEPLAVELSFEPEALCAQAVEETGRSEFGDDAFRERLAVLTRAIDRDTVLSPMGTMSMHRQLVGHLKNRLLVEDLIAEHPQILDVTIERPIVIVGQPRTSTRRFRISSACTR